MAKRSVALAMAIFGVGVLYSIVPSRGLAQGRQGRAALANGVASAKVSLDQGLAATESQGKPISAKFELDKGKLQLSVYVMKGTTFSEAVVDYTSGKIAEQTPITEGEDLAAAKSQSAAMAKATRSLRDAVVMALKANPGFLAVSVRPSMVAGHAKASVELVKGQTFKTVSEPLD
jgi:hypothetical protein